MHIVLFMHAVSQPVRTFDATDSGLYSAICLRLPDLSGR